MSPMPAAVADDAAADRGQVAVAGRAELEVDQLAGRRVGGREVLPAAEHDPDRPPELERGGGRQRLGDHQLAAERAADRRRLDPDAVDREPERRREALARHERALRARVDDELAVRLDPGQRRLRLEVRLVDPARPEPAGDDDVGALEAGRGVAAVDAAGGRRRWASRVAAARPRFSRLGAGGLALVTRRRAGVRAGGAVVPRLRGHAHRRRAGGERRLDVEHRRQRIGVDDDQRGAVLGGRLGLGDHERDRLAGPDDLLARQRLRGAAGAAGQRQVGGREHGDDARHRRAPRCRRCR